MSVTVVATAKGSTSNSYVTAAETVTYMDARLDVAEWTAASTDTRNRSIVMATSRLEQEDYRGTPTDTDQALKWPRSGLTDDDGRIYDQDVIPDVVKEATFELALELLKAGVELKNTGLDAFKSIAVGPIQVSPRSGYDPGKLPKQVTRLLKGLRVAYSGMNLRLDRG